MAPRGRQCPMCDQRTFASYCCGIDLTVQPRGFAMTKPLLRMVHVQAARKGLDDETYRLRLRAAGVESSKEFTREQFKSFMAELSKLPDVGGRTARG